MSTQVKTRTAASGTFIILLGFLLYSNALAAKGFYSGVKLGRMKTDGIAIPAASFENLVSSRPGATANLIETSRGETLSESQTLYIGYTSRYYDIELGYMDLGTTQTSGQLRITDPNSGNINFNIDSQTKTGGYYSAISGKLPLQRTISISGKLGIHSWEQRQRLFLSDATLNNSPGTTRLWDFNKNEDISVFYGVGLKWQTLGLEYTRHEINSVDFDILTLAFEYRLSL